MNLQFCLLYTTHSETRAVKYHSSYLQYTCRQHLLFWCSHFFSVPCVSIIRFMDHRKCWFLALEAFIYRGLYYRVAHTRQQLNFRKQINDPWINWNIFSRSIGAPTEGWANHSVGQIIIIMFPLPGLSHLAEQAVSLTTQLSSAAQ